MTLPLQSRYEDRDRASGFTLVELLVTIALFSILVSIAAGGFVRAMRSEREVSAMMFTESNVSVTLEEMTRELRTGYLFCDSPGSTVGSPKEAPECQSWCSISSSGSIWTCSGGIEFYNANGEHVEYFLGTSNNPEAPTSTILYRYDNGTTTPLTSGNVSITNLSFTLLGNSENDQWNPRITIAVGAEPNDSTVSWTTANLETTVSARAIDCVPNTSPAQC